MGDIDNITTPSLATTYQYYEDNKLQYFMDAATALLEHAGQLLNRYGRIQPLTLLANTAEDPDTTEEYLKEAGALYNTASAYRQIGDGAILQGLGTGLGTGLDEIRDMVCPDDVDPDLDEPDAPDFKSPTQAFGYGLDGVVEEAGRSEQTADDGKLANGAVRDRLIVLALRAHRIRASF